MGTDLVQANSLGLTVLEQDPSAVLTALRENLGGEEITAGDLDRVKIPAGGATQWAVPVLGAEQYREEIVGVIVFQRLVRAYWSNPEPSDGTPPDCSSPDSVLGYGTPGDALRAEGKGCAECPMSTFGSAPGDKEGQACKQMRELYMLTADSGALPVLVSLPPTSLAPAKKFILSLAKQGISYYAHAVKVTLEKASNKSGQPYAKARFASVGPLDPETLERVKDYAKACEGLFARRLPIDVDATTSNGSEAAGEE